jgi:hypothetical protein
MVSRKKVVFSLMIISTTPGVDLKIPKGWKSLIGFKNGKTWREHMQTEVTWREPHIGVEKGKVYANVAIGPRITLGGALPGTKKMAFDLQARLDMPKIELAAGQEKGKIPTFDLVLQQTCSTNEE